ncbi:class A beta-lactamase [Leekyejoonella antrihumi]|uniref:Class A beta-lactamase n=2 Tax=Leekyejoonella antrihumi TaxID=1660198 RepID=A0A563DVB1_9MICO|nr:class A beta-lactamase [Leekyejoonella antrihumi]
MKDGVPRRAALLAGLGAAGAMLSGCGDPGPDSRRVTPTKASGTAYSRSPSPTALAAPDLDALESTFGGKVGLYALDTGTGAAVRHRADERFLMCSTYKVLVVSATLSQAQARPRLMDQVVHFRAAEVLPYSPVTSTHTAESMTVSALCDAALTRSDNTAANLLVDLVGGPTSVTKYVRTLDDPETRVDRDEPALNIADGSLDTTTADAIGADLLKLVLGDALTAQNRKLLTAWLKANTTGDRSIRAGLPRGWAVGDKTGSGVHGEVNDVAVIWPPRRAPLIMAIYTRPTDPGSTEGYHAVARATRIALKALAIGA